VSELAALTPFVTEEPRSSVISTDVARGGPCCSPRFERAPGRAFVARVLLSSFLFSRSPLVPGDGSISIRSFLPSSMSDAGLLAGEDDRGGGRGVACMGGSGFLDEFSVIEPRRS
jgi:hypothetical protein